MESLTTTNPPHLPATPAIDAANPVDLANPIESNNRDRQLQMLRDRLRPGQRRMAEWQGGSLAVSAVPGSGKSTGMAIAATLLLANRYLGKGASPLDGNSLPTSPSTLPALKQLILVTFTRSAVANLKTKIRQALKELSLPAQGFQVYTLHGLALNIANRYPDLSGLDLNRMTLVLPNQTNRLIRTCVEQWISDNPHPYQRLLEGQQFDGEETERLRRQSVLRTEVLPDLACIVIHEAKSSGLMPKDLYQLSQVVQQQQPLMPPSRANLPDPIPDYDILGIAAGLYDRYQHLLRQRNFVDYDDMILAALRVLDHEKARQTWQSQIFAVFEDEAQDSSPLQTRLLELLAADPTQPGLLNLVRVGDPNQAINSTFTPADPSFFRKFCAACDRHAQLAEMDQAGRSSPMIMAAANFLVDWVNQTYTPATPSPSSPSTLVTSALHLPFRPQQIHPVAADDPQTDANPTPIGIGLEIRFPSDTYHTVALIAERVAQLLTENPAANAAVLVRENRQGRFLSEMLTQPQHHGLGIDLRQLGIQIYDVGEQERHSHIPAEILTILQFLDRPHSPDYLKAALQILVDRHCIPSQDLNAIATLPEQFLYPSLLEPPQAEPVLQARRYCVGLLRARLELPQYQLIPFLAMTLKYDQTELATAEKLGDRIIQQTSFNQSLSAVLEALGEMVRSERFEPVETDNPEGRYIRPQQLTIMTMHKAKGLDWDFVFIPFLHDHLIPGQMRVLPQAQFLGDFTLPEVARAQIRAQIHGEDLIPNTLTAWERAQSLKTAEEYRLLYVAMTRAKRLLWMSAARKAPFTWSKPENLDSRLPCPVLPALVNQFPSAIQ